MTPWEQIQAQHRRAVTAAGEFLVAKVQEKISKPNFDGKSPSAPGEPPRLVTGDLQSSIYYTANADGNLTVHAAMEYGDYLEYGTSKMAARPFLRPTMIENQGKVMEILAQGQ